MYVDGSMSMNGALPRGENCTGAISAGVGNRDYALSRSDGARAQLRSPGHRSVSCPNTMIDPAVRGESRFEFRRSRAQDIPSTLQNALDCADKCSRRGACAEPDRLPEYVLSACRDSHVESF